MNNEDLNKNTHKIEICIIDGIGHRTLILFYGLKINNCVANRAVQSNTTQVHSYQNDTGGNLKCVVL